LAGIRDAINNSPDNKSVKASLLTVSDGQGGTATKLVLTSTKTGADSQISITAADADGNNTDAAGLSQLAYTKDDATTGAYFSEVKAAKDAKITLDGFEVSSATNEFKDAIQGVTITALSEAKSGDDPPTADLTVGVDTSSVKTAINKFVTAYNSYIFTYKQLTSYNAQTEVAGPLQGNSSIANLGSRIRSGLSNAVVGAPNDFNSLANLGITTNADGSLKVDDTKLTAALKNRLPDVATLFSGTNGVASRLDTQLTDILGTGGLFANSQKTLDTQLKNLDKQQTALNDRMTKLEASYRAQFTALDTLVAQLKQTGNYVNSQLAALSSSNS
jgi:flagellar hook-associated protein 2